MLEIILFIVLGTVLGIFTGIVPGLHVNTVSLLFMGLTQLFDPLLLALAIVSMSISHTFFDFIPSIFLGAPDPDTALSVLPGHKLLLKGRGYEAVYLTVIGGLVAAFAAVISLPLFIAVLPFIYVHIQPHIALILAAIAAAVILSDRKLVALLIFLASGLLGFTQFEHSLLPQATSLFVLFTGLFGISTLLISLGQKSKIPKQFLSVNKPARKQVLSSTLKGLFSGSLLGTLPGLGAAQAAILASPLSGKKNQDRQFLMSLGAINTVVALFSLVSLYTISRARSGAAVAVQDILGTVTQDHLFLFAAATLLSASIAAFLTLWLASRLANRFSGVNYYTINLATIIFLIAMVAIFAGPFGLLILFASVSIGILPPIFGARRINLMGVLMFPLILFYLGV